MTCGDSALGGASEQVYHPTRISLRLDSHDSFCRVQAATAAPSPHVGSCYPAALDRLVDTDNLVFNKAKNKPEQSACTPGQS
jgi:hypothetical protein